METVSECPVDVSILVPTHNCRAYLDRCLVSLLIQRVSKEIIVVDDGSTDDTRSLLDLYAAHHPNVIKVVYQDHSGTPGSPRNRALALARGRYVFFCDADDYLGADALNRMLTTADHNGADIVLGKIIGHGRRAPESMFRENADRVTLLESTVYNSLVCFKLFRRDLLDRHGIRFDETLRVGEDMVFTAHAYCHAGVISVVSDYDCYHLISRPDGSSVMQELGSRDPLAWLRMARVPIGLMVRHVPPGPLRDHLLLRHFRLDVFDQLGAPFLAADEADREKIAIEAADICAEWLTEGVIARLGAADRMRVESLHDLDRLVRLARVETAALRHRLTTLEWDDDRLVIGGHVSLDGFEGDACLLLRERTTRRERRVPITRVADLFSVSIRVTSLPTGMWDVYAAVDCEGVRRLARLGGERMPGLDRPEPRFTSGVVALPYLTRQYGNLSVDIGGHLARVPASVRLAGARWLRDRLRVEGVVEVAGEPAGVAVRHLVWRERRSGREWRTAARAVAPGTFVAEMRWPAPGTWDAYLELDVGGPPVRFPVKIGDLRHLPPPLAWWSGLARWGARPYATAVNRRLSTAVRVVTPFTVLRKLLRRR
ncbi:glycosyltransferase family 2 protein [Microtetraspora sp. AC03309]|uniref:glycosyltransferase family 2 protein n=1 Tax=Microtetraspora sp. AC03309 TaxID=2779376 RepID=UPI001E4273A9|nr:glycosyltransferase family A protein [Microtetraspora sp. AC03309]MCC5580122.1 glycosyltransferase family 2 protein [Microtetraspora sp. AC03309]